jgi:hypothetical protein
MLLTMFGVPTPLTERGVGIVRALAKVALDDSEFVAAGSAGELRAAWAKLNSKNVIYYHESPDNEITSFFRKSAVPILAFLDDPVEVAYSLCRERRLAVLDAMRASSLCFAGLEGVVLSKDTLVIDVCKRNDLSFQDFLETICHHFDLPYSDLLVMAVMRALREQAVIGSGVISSDTWSIGLQRGGVPEAAVELLETVQTCLAPYRRIQERKHIQHVRWPPSAFMSMDHGGKPAVGLFDMTGKSRIFFYGPYLGLPPGRWIAQVDFEVSDNRMGCVLQVNAISKDFLTQGRVQLPCFGRYTCTIPFETMEPKWPVEIHFTLNQGVLQGQLGLLNVEIRRQLNGSGGTDEVGLSNISRLQLS